MTIHIGILVFPRVQQLDLTGPYEVFASLADAQMHLVWKDRQPVMSATGLILTPTVAFADCPALDVLCIPGGIGINDLLQDEQTLAFIRDRARQVRFLTSVCTGALVLGAAGLLEGRRATTHWNALDLLERFGAVPVRARVVRDGRLFTGGGVTAGIDFALTVASELLGHQQAEEIQLSLEYAPAPPFDAGEPATASPAVLDAVRRRLAAGRRERERIIGLIRPNRIRSDNADASFAG